MKKLLITIMCICLSLGLMSCGSEKKEELTVAYFDNITHGQALVMKQNNTLQEMLGDDTKVKWVSFNAGPAEVEACFSGDVNIGYIGPVPAATAVIKSKGEFVIISGATNRGAVLIARKGASISSAKDLEGKKVAIPQLGNTQHLLLLDLLKENNLKTTSEGGTVDVVESENADVANLIDSGDIDAALVPEPWGSTILKKTDSQTVLDYNELQNGESYSTAVVIVNKEYMEEHKDIVKKFLKAHMDATEYIVQNPNEAAKVMNAQLDEDTHKSLDDDIIIEAISKIDYSSSIAKESIINYSEISKEQKFISKKLTESAFDNSLMKELTK